MYFERVYEKGLAHASYIVGCQATGDAVVIDPKRDVEDYLSIAEREGLKIKFIAETHIHADFVSGTRELSKITGAEMLLSDEGGKDWQYQFRHTGLFDKDNFMVGNLKFEVLHTPGHTPEHISFLLTDTPAGDSPVMLFTGDFVFVGDVGRPDLLEKAAGIKGTQEIGANQMFDSIKKFKALPDYVQVWPAHGAGSACGKALGAVPSSTVGYEKKVNWALQIEDKDEFVNQLLDGQPEPPKYFANMKKVNKEGPEILGALPHPARLTYSQFENYSNNGVKLIDTRDKFAFAGGHLPNAINIQDNNSFSTWAGWILKPNEKFILLASESRIEDLVKKLIRIGLDNVAGYITSVTNYAESNNELEVLKQITAKGLSDLYNSGEVKILDVRGKSEFEMNHIPGAINIHAGLLEDNLDKLDKNQHYALHCVSGDRSSIACSVLKRNGFENLSNLTGGISMWAQEGLELTALNKEEIPA